MNTSSLRPILGLTLAALVLGGAVLSSSSQGQDELKRNSRPRFFMRKKLEYAKNVLEGLTTEDLRMITINARALKDMSMAAEWEVSTIPNVELYVPYTSDFQRLCDDLQVKARDRNLDGATLAYVQMTLSCVKCHKYVKDATRPK